MSTSGNVAKIEYRFLLPPHLPARNADIIFVPNRRGFEVQRLVLAPVATGEVTYWRPIATDQCWAAQPPCASEPTSVDVRYADRALGFKGGLTVVRSGRGTATF